MRSRRLDGACSSKPIAGTLRGLRDETEMASFAEDAVRAVALEGFARIGVAPDEIDCFEEEILIRDGRQMARTYRAGECAAMWLIPVNLLQFYHRDGDMLLTVDLWERLAPPVPQQQQRRMAA